MHQLHDVEILYTSHKKTAQNLPFDLLSYVPFLRTSWVLRHDRGQTVLPPYTLGNVKCVQCTQNWTYEARGQTHAADRKTQGSAVLMNYQAHLRMCSINHRTMYRYKEKLRRVISIYTWRSTGENTVDGPWSSGESIPFHKMAQGTLKHPVAYLHAPGSIRMNPGTIPERLWVKKRKSVFFLQVCGPEMYYYQTIRRKRLWKSSEWKRIVQSFWDTGKSWCSQ